MEEVRLRSLRDRQKEKMTSKENSPAPRAETAESGNSPLPDSKKKLLIKKAFKLLLLSAFVFLVGGLGGVWMDRIFLPNLLVKYPDLNQYNLLKRMNERTTIIRETEEVTISQEEGTAEAIARVRPSVTEIMAKNTSGQFAPIGTGIIFTSDGYILTPLKNIYSGAALNTELQIRLKDGTSFAAEIISQNTDFQLAILKIGRDNLPVIPYADSDNLRLGEKLIIVDDAITTDIISRIIDNYVMPGSTDSSYQKRIQIVQDLGENSSGAAVINVEGKLVGISQEGNLIIPINELREYITTGIVKQ
jgi:S1-C subfamily serine protease